MANRKSRVIIIAHTFPPFGGVAGRRWALYSEALVSQGFQVEIITAKGRDMTSPWSVNENIQITYLNDYYPNVLKVTPSSFLEKAKYRLSRYLLNRLHKGTPYDRGIFWVKNVRRLLKKRKGLANTFFILTGGPFSTFSLADLIFKNKGKVWLDFRDPYSWGTSYGMSSISEGRLLYELNNEKRAVELADQIFAPNSTMLNKLESLYPDYSNKLRLLPHPIDYKNIETKWIAKPTDQLKLVYAGTLYGDCSARYVELLDVLEANPHISYTIYTNQDTVPLDVLGKLKSHSQVHLFPTIPAKALFSKLKSYDAYLIVSPERVKHFISTKYPDLIYFEIPILLYSSSGKLTNFLEGYKRSIVINSKQELERGLKGALDLGKESPSFDLSEYNQNKVIQSFNL